METRNKAGNGGGERNGRLFQERLQSRKEEIHETNIRVVSEGGTWHTGLHQSEN